MEKIATRVITVAATVIVVNAANGLKITGNSRSLPVQRPDVELRIMIDTQAQSKKQDEQIDQSRGCFSGC
jgi:hypothetical protein